MEVVQSRMGRAASSTGPNATDPPWLDRNERQRAGQSGTCAGTRQRSALSPPDLGATCWPCWIPETSPPQAKLEICTHVRVLGRIYRVSNKHLGHLGKPPGSEGSKRRRTNNGRRIRNMTGAPTTRAHLGRALRVRITKVGPSIYSHRLRPGTRTRRIQEKSLCTGSAAVS